VVWWKARLRSLISIIERAFGGEAPKFGFLKDALVAHSSKLQKPPRLQNFGYHSPHTIHKMDDFRRTRVLPFAAVETIACKVGRAECHDATVKVSCWCEITMALLSIPKNDVRGVT